MNSFDIWLSSNFDELFVGPIMAPVRDPQKQVEIFCGSNRYLSSLLHCVTLCIDGVVEQYRFLSKLLTG